MLICLLPLPGQFIAWVKIHLSFHKLVADS